MFFPLQTATVAYLQWKIQLSVFSAYQDSSPSQLIRVSEVLLCYDDIFYAQVDTKWHLALLHDIATRIHSSISSRFFFFRKESRPISGSIWYDGYRGHFRRGLRDWSVILSTRLHLLPMLKIFGLKSTAQFAFTPRCWIKPKVRIFCLSSIYIYIYTHTHTHT